MDRSFCPRLPLSWSGARACFCSEASEELLGGSLSTSSQEAPALSNSEDRMWGAVVGSTLVAESLRKRGSPGRAGPCSQSGRGTEEAKLGFLLSRLPLWACEHRLQGMRAYHANPMAEDARLCIPKVDAVTPWLRTAGTSAPGNNQTETV